MGAIPGVKVEHVLGESRAEGILVQGEESGVAPSAAEPLRVDETVVEGSGVVDGADEVVVAGERGREVRVACVVSRGVRAVSGRGGEGGGRYRCSLGVSSEDPSQTGAPVGCYRGGAASAGGSRAPMPSVVRSPANSDILRRVPRARWTLAASTRQYPLSASRFPELSFLSAPRRLGLDDLAATRKVLALARRGRRVPKVENARLRDVTSGNPNPRGAVARRGVESDASIFAFHVLLLRYFFLSRFRGGVAEYLTGRGFTRGGARGVLVGEIGLSTLDAVSSRRCVARCAVVRPVSRGVMLRRKKGRRVSKSAKISNWRFFARETPTSGKRTKTNRRS